jgi:tetratricopeptide (TPR) repeat protein
VSVKTLIEHEFTGRRNEINLFERLIDGRLKKTFLVYYGIGGIGKSWLVRKLIAEYQQCTGFIYAYIDFSHSQSIDYLSLLNSLQNQLNTNAFGRFNSMVGEYVRQMRTIYISTQSGTHIPNVNIDVRNNVFTGGVGDIVGIKFEDVDIAIPRDELNRLQQEMQQKTTQAFLDDLKQLAHSVPIMLFFDTYERIEDPESNRATEIAHWLRTKVLSPIREAENSIRVVIARRRDLTWQLEDREWRKQIRSVELKPFKFRETTTYISKRKIGRGDLALRRSIYKLTQGHPQCVSLACDLIEDAKSYGEKITSTVFDNYRSEFDERLVSEFLMEAILSRLPQTLTDAVRLCAIPHYFEAETIRTMLTIENGSQGILDQIKRYSFVYPVPRRGYLYHEVIRRLLITKWRHDDNSGWRLIHQKLLGLIEQRLQSREYEEEHKDLQVEKLYHQAHVDEEEALILFCYLFNEADKALLISYCEKLIEIMDETRTEIDLRTKTKKWIDYYKARTFYLKGEWQAAENMLQALLTFTEDLRLWATVAANLGMLYQSNGHLDNAIHWLKESLRVREQINEESGIIQSLNELGSAHRANIELEEALLCYDRSCNIATSNNPTVYSYEIAYSRLYSGVIYTGRGKYEEALSAYQDALAIFQKLNDRYGIARVYQRLGWMARIRGRLEEARDYHLQTLKDLEQLGFPHPLAESLHSMGNIYRLLSDWDEAADYYQRALNIFQKLGATRHVGILQNDIGWLYQNRGMMENKQELLSEALGYFNKSLDIKRSLGQHRETGPSLCSIGEIYIALGRWPEAEQYLLASLQIAQEIKVRINEARTLASLCELNYARGDIKEMQKYGESTLFIAKTDNYNHYVAQVYRIYGDSSLDIKSFNLAAENYAHALCFAVRYNKGRYEQIVNHIFGKCNASHITSSQRGSFYQLIIGNLSESCQEELENVSLADYFLNGLNKFEDIR